jgi:hypothetical protein
MKHRTTHSAESFTDNGKSVVFVSCYDCSWKDKVDVSDLTWTEAMTLIFRVRDAHESLNRKEGNK